MSTPPGPSERRLLTVAFCDLVGSTALSAGIDDETYAEVMARYYASAQKVVTGHGGFVARREGDGIFVYIGHPHPHEDDADRAVRMGLELVETISRIHDGRGGRLRGRVGIHTGPTVMVRSELEPTSMAFGFTPNFAARLEGTAEPGQVLISSATAALLRGEFDLGEHVNVPIDDTTSLTARPVLAAHDRNRLVSTRLPAPFVGRGDLLARLHERWAEAVLVGTRPVVLVGEPGVGKSRLAEELISHVAPTGATPIVVYCDERTRNVPLAPVRAALRALVPEARIDARVDELADERLTHPAAAIRRVLGFAPTVDELPGVDPEKLHDDEIEVVARLATSRRIARPTVVVIDDLQWADLSTLAVLERTARTDTAGVLIVVTTRPDRDLLARLGALDPTVIEVDPLSPTAVAALVHELDTEDRIDDAGRQRIVERSTGIPLYVEALAAAHGSDPAAPPTPGVALPAILEQHLLARLHQSGMDTSTVSAAATVGRTFEDRLVAEALGQPIADVRSTLTTLTTTGVVEPEGRPGWYRFHHPLVQEVAYSIQTSGPRRDRHRRVAAALSGTHELETMAVRAFHLDRAELTADAVDAYLAAGTSARITGAYSDALALLDRSIELIGSLEPALDTSDRELHARQLRAFFLVATDPTAYHAAGDDYRRSMEILAGRPPHLDHLHAITGLWAMAMQSGDLDGAETLLHQFRVIATTRAPGLLVANRSGFGIVCAFRGEFAAAEDQLESSAAGFAADGWSDDVSLVWPTPDHPPAVNLGVLGWVRRLRGRANAATATSDALAMVEHLPPPVGPHNMAFVHAYGALEREVGCDGHGAALHGQRIVEIARSSGSSFWEGNGMMHIALGAALTDPNPETLGALMATSAVLEAMGAESFLPFIQHSVGQTQLEMKLTDEARGSLEQAIATSVRHGNGMVLAESLRLLAHTHHGEQRRRHLEDARTTAGRQGALLYELRALIDLVRLDPGRDQLRTELSELIDRLPSDDSYPERALGADLLR